MQCFLLLSQLNDRILDLKAMIIINNFLQNFIAIQTLKWFGFWNAIQII